MAPYRRVPIPPSHTARKRISRNYLRLEHQLARPLAQPLRIGTGKLEDFQVPETTITDPQNPEIKYGRSVSLMQAAALLQVSRRTVYNRIRDGQLTTIRIHGSQRVLTSSLFGSNGLLQEHSTDPGFTAQL